MGLDFYAACTPDEIYPEASCAHLALDLLEELYCLRDTLPQESAAFLRLDPYGDTAFEGLALTELESACEALLIVCGEYTDEDTVAPAAIDIGLEPEVCVELISFLHALECVCAKAREDCDVVLALGD